MDACSCEAKKLFLRNECDVFERLFSGFDHDLGFERYLICELIEMQCTSQRKIAWGDQDGGVDEGVFVHSVLSLLDFLQ